MSKFENYNDVYAKIEWEGLDYFIQSYCSGDCMPDEKGAELFQEAYNLLENCELDEWEDTIISEEAEDAMEYFFHYVKEKAGIEE